MHVFQQHTQVRKKKTFSIFCAQKCFLHLNAPTDPKPKLTGCNDGRHRSALRLILNSHNTDVVLNTWNEVIQSVGVLAGLHKFLHAVSDLPIGWSACHFVASDI